MHRVAWLHMVHIGKYYGRFSWMRRSLWSVAFLAYGAYLLLPIVLLVIGSFGQNWTNTLLPNGATGQWYAELWHDAAFRRASPPA